jgi:hypothetical protein
MTFPHLRYLIGITIKKDKMKLSTSANIIRDLGKQTNYIVTANAIQILGKIISKYHEGQHSFTLIGSYGTGKSSFLLELEECLLCRSLNKPLLIKPSGQFDGFNKYDFINIIGDYDPLSSILEHYLKQRCNKQNKNIFSLLDSYYQSTIKEGKFLFIYIDEFGKILEHAAKNNPEKEMYFLQQFCEYINDTDKHIILLTTLHQGFNSYANKLTETQRQEWNKVKGRLQEILFKEPIEQLLNLAATKVSTSNRRIISKNNSDRLFQLAIESHFADASLCQDVITKLYPMDIFAAYIMTLANQKYGQNERTLFTFLAYSGDGSLNDFTPEIYRLYSVAEVYDYLLYNFHSYLSEVNPDSTKWEAIRIAIERLAGSELTSSEIKSSTLLVKTIGLLNIFSSSAAKIDKNFLTKYSKLALGIKDAETLLDKLAKLKIIRYARYRLKYILYEGTDVDIEASLYEANRVVARTKDITDKLVSNVSFKMQLANAYYYATGTPRYFEYQISNTPIQEVHISEIDGYINILIPHREELKAITETCLNTTGIPVVYIIFKSTDMLSDHVFELDKLNWVKDHCITDNDRVATREIDKLIGYEKSILTKELIEGLYDKAKVSWYFNGKEVDNILSEKDLIKYLSSICNIIYPYTPIFKNELINKHKPSGTISVARQIFLQHLLESIDKKNIGFEDDKFPPEKSIYLTLLKEPGIHESDGITCHIGRPTEPSFMFIWDECERFLKSTIDKQRRLIELSKILSKPPYGLKQGLHDIWLPTFLIIKKEDYALYFEDTYIPYINREILELFQRELSQFSIKSFSVEGVKLEFFKKYRQILGARQVDLKGQSFIETIKPFLTFYKKLNNYAKQTKHISPKARIFRDVISRAKDPEKTFFEDLPEKLGFKRALITMDPESINEFVDVLQSAMRSLRNCYDTYISEIENNIIAFSHVTSREYVDYKKEIDSKYLGAKASLMPLSVKNFYQRLISPSRDKREWIESLCYLIIRKPLSDIKDEENDFLITSLGELFFTLDDYVKIKDKKDKNILVLHITQVNEITLTKQVIIPKNLTKDIESVKLKVTKLLSKDDSINIAALSEILKEKMKNEKS